NENIHMLHKSHEPFLYEFISEQLEKAGFVPKISPHGFWVNAIVNILLSSNDVSILPEKIAEFSKNPAIRLIPIEDAECLQLTLLNKKGLNSKPLDALIEYLMQGNGSSVLAN